MGKVYRPGRAAASSACGAMIAGRRDSTRAQHFCIPGAVLLVFPVCDRHYRPHAVTLCLMGAWCAYSVDGSLQRAEEWKVKRLA